MTIKLLLVFGVASFAIFSADVLAQAGVEASANYSLVIYNPAKSIADSRNLNGGGGSIGFNLGEYLTLKGELEGYVSTTLTFHIPPTAISTGGTFKTRGNMFTYLFGSQLNIPMSKKRLFGEALFGGAYSDVYANLFKAANVQGLSASITDSQWYLGAAWILRFQGT